MALALNSTLIRAIEQPADDAVVWTVVQNRLGRYAACGVADGVLTTKGAQAADAAYLAFPTQAFPNMADCISGKNKGQQRPQPAAPQLLDPPLPVREAARAAIRCWLMLR